MARRTKGSFMEVLKKFEIDLIKDRCILKWRINSIKSGLIIGSLKPVDYFLFKTKKQ
jgi:hypothetical protein